MFKKSLSSEAATCKIHTLHESSILYYAIEVCPLNKAHIISLDFSVSSCFTKIICIKSRETITECMRLFNCQSVKNVAEKKNAQF